MATAEQIITRAFSMAGIKTSETPLEATEMQDGLDLMNDLCISYENDLKLGFSPVEVVGDNVRIPREAEHAIKANLAVRLQIEYLLPVDAKLLEDASNSLERLIRQQVTIDDVDYPDTLPMGSGNRCSNEVGSDFFPSSEKVNF